MDKKIDPINEKYFKPLESIQVWIKWLFYSVAILSVTIFFVEQQSIKEILSLVFTVLVVVMFALNTAVHLYFYPKAQTKRQQDFLEHANAKIKQPDNTKNYYNNNAKAGYRRLVSQLLENLFYSKSTGVVMIKKIRVQVSIYFLIWLLVVIFRGSDYSLILIISQLIFSEQILTYWFRFEKLQNGCENLYDQVYKLATNTQESTHDVYETLIKYETLKANTAITYSSEVFEKIQHKNDDDWEKIRAVIVTEE